MDEETVRQTWTHLLINYRCGHQRDFYVNPRCDAAKVEQIRQARCTWPCPDCLDAEVLAGRRGRRAQRRAQARQATASNG